MRVREYSPVPCDVSQLKRANTSLVPAMKPRSSKGGGRTSIFISRDANSLLHPFPLPISTPSFILFYLLGGLEDTCMVVCLVQEFIFKWTQLQGKKVSYSDFIEQITFS